MHALDNFIATATQLKVERPGKAAAITVCDSIDGPIVKLKNGSVKFLETEKIAKEYKKEIKEILFLGDILVNYGDFLNRAHPLIPPGYCQEWWILEFEKKITELFGTLDYEKTAEIVNIDAASLKALFRTPLTTKISPKAALRISSTLKLALHPRHTSYWTTINSIELKQLVIWLFTGKQEDGKIIINTGEEKKILEKIGLEHDLINKEKIVIGKNTAIILLATLGCLEFSDLEITLKKLKQEQEDDILKILNKISLIPIKDKAGIFIGCRMGRPEKSKMRKMTGSPHSLFPVGLEGGRLRSFQAALEIGKITAAFSIFNCKKCEEKTVYATCQECKEKTERIYYCFSCGEINEKECKIHGKTKPYKITEVDIKKHFKQILKGLGEKVYPDLIKGVRETPNQEHIPEHLSKGILRAKHNIYVNKDGTTRYDCSEVPITHFKPKEIFIPIEKLKKLGYEKDWKGKNITSENQVIELKPQDIILPCPINTTDEPADEVLFRITKFLDELLVKSYNMKPYYNLRSKEDLIGHYTVGLAPHTSAGTLSRIIGFSRTQGLFAHPLLHAAMRRDCDGDESSILLLLDAFLNFSQKYLPQTRGATMDAPIVLTSILNPAEVDDMIFDMDIATVYPLKFYEACQEYKMPWEVKIDKVGDHLDDEKKYSNYGFTHPTNNINEGVLCSVYKTLPTMEAKLKGQMKLAEKIRAVDTTGVAKLVIEKHFLKDIRGNLRKFSQQQFRCVKCNEKFRRPPLSGICTVCNGKIIFTISEGSTIKYLEPSLGLAKKYKVDDYLVQTLELTKKMVEDVFGKDKKKQTGLGDWFA
jgi:DNA polymerase II large subunit